MSAKILDGKVLSEKIKAQLKSEISDFKQKGRTLALASIQVGDDPASKFYIRSQKRNCDELGIQYQLHQLESSISEIELLGFIQNLNSDKSVTGIIVQTPLPDSLDTKRVQSAIAPEKDVDGTNPANMGLLALGFGRLAPSTAMGVMELINYSGIDPYGKEAVILGRSEIVGRPVAFLLLSKSATVTICHTGTTKRGSLPDHVKRAEILVVAAGKPNLVKGEWIKEGAVVIDVGTNRVGDKTVGDVEFEVASQRAAYITPVPGGVGPMTVAMLMKNLVNAAKWQSEKIERARG